MVAFIKLASLVVAATAASAAWDFDVRELRLLLTTVPADENTRPSKMKFTRYHDSECKVAFSKAKRMHDNNCYTFHLNALGPFHSFTAYDNSNMWKKYGNDRPGCAVTVWSGDNCTAEGYSLGDAAATFGECGVFAPGYRSASVTCGGGQPKQITEREVVM